MTQIVIDGLSLEFECNSLGRLENHPLGISTSSSRALHLLALLIGAVKIINEDSSTTQGKNYMVIGAPPSSPFASQNLERSFSDLREEINGKLYFKNAKKIICNYLNSQRSNHNLFSPLFNELARSIIQNNNKKGLSAFVHIYRAFENSSFTFPLFYCRYEKEYLKVYNLLKDFFKGGELDFCSNFFQHLVIQEGLEQLQMEIKFKGTHAAEFATCMLNYVSWNEKNHGNTITSASQSSVQISFKYCFDLIVRLRNGFFHHLAGSNSSISSLQIKNADEFFIPINELALQVFGFIYGKIIRTHL